MGKITHGLTNTREFRAWSSMKDRCLRKENARYHQYGGRGISIHPDWMMFEEFYIDMGPCPEGLTLERVDNNGNYCPENCIWATKKQQAHNRRAKIKYVTFDGRTQCVTDWAKELGMAPTTLYARIFTRKWSIQKAFTNKKHAR